MNLFRVAVVILGFSSCIYPMLAYGYDHERAQANLADDAAQCSAYYSLSLAAAKDNNEKDIAKALEPSVRAASYMLSTLLNGNLEKSKAKLEMAFQNETEIVNNEGYARLILKYSSVCKQLLEHPEIRIRYWEKKQ